MTVGVSKGAAAPSHYRIIEGDCRDMSDLPSGSVDLVFTSPPYFCAKRYDENPANIGNLTDFYAYLAEMKKVFLECVRVLKDGSFLIVNVSDIRLQGKTVPIPAYFIRMLCELEVGPLTYREDIIWEKFVIITDMRFGVTVQNPEPKMFYPNGIYEHTLVFLKGKQVIRCAEPGEALDIRRMIDEGFKNNVWHIAPDTDMAQNHEAPFPVKYAENVIKLYSCPGDLVLDPFCGIGTSLLVAKSLKRDCIGFEINPANVKLAAERCGFDYRTLVPMDVAVQKQLLHAGQEVMSLVDCPVCGTSSVATVGRETVDVQCDRCGKKSMAKDVWRNYAKSEGPAGPSAHPNDESGVDKGVPPLSKVQESLGHPPVVDELGGTTSPSEANEK